MNFQLELQSEWMPGFVLFVGIAFKGRGFTLNPTQTARFPW
jgi:hypothetical protein